jgi:hypothetical protein
MREYPKSVMKLIRQYARQAHEEELRRALEPLGQKFDEWRAGSVSSGDLSEIIHKFHSGPSRELFKSYNEPFPPDLAVARAIVVGVLDEKEIDKAVLSHLEPAMQLYQERK